VILYRLHCDHEHEFEAWFASSAAYDRAARGHANACPACSSTKVEKAIMAPSLGTGTRKGEVAAPPPAQPDASAKDAAVTLAAVDPRQQALLAAVREFRQKVKENAEYVGDRFAEEARKIHYEESPPRGIWGEATREDAEALAEEGIEFAPLPPIPEAQN
jgi:hypothetical protein